MSKIRMKVYERDTPKGFYWELFEDGKSTGWYRELTNVKQYAYRCGCTLEIHRLDGVMEKW